MENRMFRKKIEYKTVKELVEDVGTRYKGQYVYSYRITPRDKDVVKIKFEDMRDDVRALATEFISRGYANKHIALIGKLTYSWIKVYWATLSIGSVLVPLDPEWTAEDLADTVNKADAETLFISSDIFSKAETIKNNSDVGDVWVLEGNDENSVNTLQESGKAKMAAGDKSYFDIEIDPDVMSLLVFTSGTTGKGKGVMLSQHAILSDLADVIPYVDFSLKSVGVLPPHHTYGSSVSILGQTSIGAEVYLSAGIRYIQKELKEQKPGHMVLVPLYLETFYRKIWANIKEQGKEKLFLNMIKISNVLRKVGIDLRRKFFKSVLDVFGGEIKMVVSGGAPISSEILEFFDNIGISVLNGYGITECAPIIAVNHSKNVVPGSVGYPLTIDDVKINEPNENGEGEIYVKGPNVMLGYYKDEETTKAAFDENGYFKTGDYGKIDKNGILFITGRLKNLIILSNGKNVYPEEIETELASVPGVLDIVVYEGQSKRGIEYNAIVAEIYPDKEYMEKNDIKDVQSYLQEYINNYNRTAISYKKIGLLRVREEEFPKNTLRKIMRFKMDMSID